MDQDALQQNTSIQNSQSQIDDLNNQLSKELLPNQRVSSQDQKIVNFLSNVKQVEKMKCDTGLKEYLDKEFKKNWSWKGNKLKIILILLIPIILEGFSFVIEKQVILACWYLSPFDGTIVSFSDDAWVCIECHPIDPNCRDNCETTPFISLQRDPLLAFLAINLLMFGVMFEIMLRMVYQTGIVKSAAPYNIKMLTGKGMSYLLKNKKQTYLTIVVGSMICGISIFLFERYSEEWSSPNCCVETEKGVSKPIQYMWFQTYDSGSIPGTIVKFVVAFLVYVEICNHILEGYIDPWKLMIGSDESSTSQITHKEILGRLKIVKNQHEIDIFDAIKIKDKNLQIWIKVKQYYNSHKSDENDPIVKEISATMEKYGYNQKKSCCLSFVSLFLAWITVCFGTCRIKALTRATHQYRTYFSYPDENLENNIVENATIIDILNQSAQVQVSIQDLFRNSKQAKDEQKEVDEKLSDQDLEKKQETN